MKLRNNDTNNLHKAEQHALGSRKPTYKALTLTVLRG